MPCDNCDRLRARVRELEEEITEWSRVKRDDSLAEKLRLRFRLRPQAAYALAAMMERPGRVFSNDALIQHMQYEGRNWDTARSGEDQSVRTNITWIRRGLVDARIGVTVRNVHGEGYVISREDAETIRGVL